MKYTIREEVLKTRKVRGSPQQVIQYQVLDETGAVRANESSRALAQAHIRELERVEQLHADAAQERVNREANVNRP